MPDKPVVTPLRIPAVPAPAAIPPVPKPQREPMTKAETMYFAVLCHWYKHRDYAPTLNELGNLCRPRKSATAVRTRMLSLESKGYVARDDGGRFVVVR